MASCSRAVAAYSRARSFNSSAWGPYADSRSCMRSIMDELSGRLHSGHAPRAARAARSVRMTGRRRTGRRLLLLDESLEVLDGVTLCGTQRDRDDETERRADQALSRLLLRLDFLDDLAHLSHIS